MLLHIGNLGWAHMGFSNDLSQAWHLAGAHSGSVIRCQGS